jgi:hypothetical protein
VKFDEIANEITANAATLQQEVVAIAAFLDGREHQFRHAHYGYLMACMGQIDVMSYCMFGPDTHSWATKPDGCNSSWRATSMRTRSKNTAWQFS